MGAGGAAHSVVSWGVLWGAAIVSEPLFSAGTWDAYRQAYTPQKGLSVPAFNIPMRQLIVAVRDLKRMGYSAHRFRDADGNYEDNDWSVLIERTDGQHWKEIRRSWAR